MADDSRRPTASRYRRLLGVGLVVGTTSCCASPIGLVAEGLDAVMVGVAEPVPWQDTTVMLPFTLSVLSGAVLTGVVLGLALCSTTERRVALARRLLALVILSGLALLGWSAAALAFLMPFIDAGTSLTGMATSTRTAVVAIGSSISLLLAAGGVGLVAMSGRIADRLSDRVFGMDSRSCRACGHPLESTVCSECGEPALGRDLAAPRHP